MSLIIKPVVLNQMPLKEIVYQSPYQKIKVLSLGATIKSWEVINQENRFENIVLSYQNDENYLNNTKFLGATIGPNAGRLHPARLNLKGQTYLLSKNFKDHANLHSGIDNFVHRPFSVQKEGENTIIMTLTNPGEMKEFPSLSKVEVKMVFEPKALSIYYTVQSDTYSIANLTNHTYFNLSGNLKTDILNHTLKLPATSHLELDEYFIPKKRIKSKHTPFDFTQFKPLKDAVLPLKDSPQKGLDHPFLLDEGCVILKDDESKRRLKITTDYDSVVIYTNNFTEDIYYQGSKKDQPHLGVALEMQHRPNDINILKRPKSFLKPNQTKQNFIKYELDFE